MQNEIKSSIKKIDSAKKILILISSPDGDSVGTSIVLKHFLENKNKIADIYSNKPLYDTLKKLPLSDEIIITDVVKINFHEYDLIITVDTANLEQLYNYNKYDKFKFPDYIDFVCIDHHASNTSFTKYKIYDKEASSTAEVLYTHLIKNDFPLNKDEATLLYFAIASDTGFFRWQIKPETFRVASKLLESNVDYNKLANLYF